MYLDWYFYIYFSNRKAIKKPNIKSNTEKRVKVSGTSTKVLPKTKPIIA